MRHGFVKVAAATPDIRVADVEFNKENICRGIEEAEKANAKILVFPELCVTGYTCSDLFDHAVLLKAAKKALLEIAEFTRDRDLLVFVGVPLEVDGKLYNVAAALPTLVCRRRKSQSDKGDKYEIDSFDRAWQFWAPYCAGTE